MLKIVLLAAALGALTACGGGDISKAQSAVKKDLFDGETARFREDRVLYMPPNKTKVVCGEVNAKNKFGAYVGFQPYVVESLDTVPFAKFSSESAGEIRTTCSLAKP
ncbi:hypothetical protein [Pseudomonas syringae]|uniref:Lipoprotein n=1 Tax=Pseudomonas syringae CC1417 TaxID=1357272 RepID=A0AAU8LE28_PSESX